MTQFYIFVGKILPERAQVSLEFSLNFAAYTGDVKGIANVSIVLNQVAVKISSDHDWDIYDLRNLVKGLIQNYLGMAGYLLGFAYELEITRVLNYARNIDTVFGIDIPCISERARGINIQESLERLMQKTMDENGVFLNRCFSDLISSMKHPEDTGFYCYRAIESLRHHCAAKFGLTNASKTKQWEKFRDVSRTEEDNIRRIKLAADPLRHGEAVNCTGEERAKLFTLTWDIVDEYLSGIFPQAEI